MCDLLRTRVTAETNSKVLKSACVRVLPHWTDIVQRIVTHSVLGVVCDLLRPTNSRGKKNSEVLKSATMRVWSHSTDLFVENRDTLRSSVWFTMHTSNFRGKTRWFSKVGLWGFDLTELLFFVENRDTLCIRSSVWFTSRTSNCRDKLGGSQKCVCEGFTSLNWYFCRESWHTPH